MSRYEKIVRKIIAIEALERELQEELRQLIDAPKNSMAAVAMPSTPGTEPTKRNPQLTIWQYFVAHAQGGKMAKKDLIKGYRKASGKSGQSAGQQLRYLEQDRKITIDTVSGIVSRR